MRTINGFLPSSTRASYGGNTRCNIVMYPPKLPPAPQPNGYIGYPAFAIVLYIERSRGARLQ